MTNATQDICASRLREVLRYDAVSGAFIWKEKIARKVVVGKEAGSFDKFGYRMIRIFGRRYFAHRLAWLHHYGDWPLLVIDHIDGNPANNAITNLRDVPQRMNMENTRKAQSDNVRSGVMGVAPNGKNWRASISVNRKQTHLGTFKTKDEAHAAYIDAKRRLHAGCTI